MVKDAVKTVLSLAEKEVGAKNGDKYCKAYGVSPGTAYCAIFVWYIMKQAGYGGLYYAGKKTASCVALLSDYRERGCVVPVETCQPGDIVFFDGLSGDKFNGVPDHVGLCKAYDGTNITSIDGNTSGPAGGSESNGGQVNVRKRNKRYILAVARPAYPESEGEDTMTQTEFNAMFKTAMAEHRAELQDNDAGAWSAAARKWNEEFSLISGAGTINGAPNMMFEDFLTREQALVLFYKWGVSQGIIDHSKYT